MLAQSDFFSAGHFKSAESLLDAAFTQVANGGIFSLRAGKEASSRSAQVETTTITSVERDRIWTQSLPNLDADPRQFHHPSVRRKSNQP